MVPLLPLRLIQDDLILIYNSISSNIIFIVTLFIFEALFNEEVQKEMHFFTREMFFLNKNKGELI